MVLFIIFNSNSIFVFKYIDFVFTVATLILWNKIAYTFKYFFNHFNKLNF